MGKLSKPNLPFFYSTILYLCGLLLFLEWVYPIEEVTDTSYRTIFIFYILFCFLLTFIQVSVIPSFLLKGLGSLFIINYLFFSDPILSKTWVSKLYVELSLNINFTFNQQWEAFSPLFRTLLFLLLIWLMSYLVYYWFVSVRRILLFILLTFIYLTLLDTFTIYDASMAIIRVFTISLFALGLNTMLKELVSESLQTMPFKKASKWMAPLVGFIILSSIIGYVTPEYNPQWADPIPYLQSATGQINYSNGSLVNKKTGYGEDDSQLGGSINQDHIPVFRVATNKKQYWRIETKDVYTGKGWTSSEETNDEKQVNGHTSFTTFSDQVDVERMQAEITFQGNITIDKLVYPYGIRQVETSPDDEDVQLQFDPITEGIYTKINGEKTSLVTYTIEYDSPSFSVNELRKEGEQDPAGLKRRYTQLPQNLPERISTLADEITSGHNNRYDKAQEIETYFGTSGFVYQLSNVPTPDYEEDYVDQFLFDSQAGYCDNYSTAMVVMLRSLEIPARWVKGFTGGEEIDSSGETNLYEITNANSHSWVEVYFPEIGWVPFEPTQGFSNLSSFHSNSGEGTEEDDADEEETLEEIEEREEEVDTPEVDAPEIADKVEQEEDRFRIKWWHGVIVLIILLIIFVILYRIRYTIKTFLVYKRVRNRHNRQSYVQAYKHLLNVLHYKGFPKGKDQTLREYARQIDDRFDSDDMGQLTAHYEQVIYNNKIKEVRDKNLIIIWRRLIRRVMK